jgi:hypothetical protein
MKGVCWPVQDQRGDAIRIAEIANQVFPHPAKEIPAKALSLGGQLVNQETSPQSHLSRP